MDRAYPTEAPLAGSLVALVLISLAIRTTAAFPLALIGTLLALDTYLRRRPANAPDLAAGLGFGSAIGFLGDFEIVTFTALAVLLVVSAVFIRGRPLPNRARAGGSALAPGFLFSLSLFGLAVSFYYSIGLRLGVQGDLLLGITGTLLVLGPTLGILVRRILPPLPPRTAQIVALTGSALLSGILLVVHGTVLTVLVLLALGTSLSFAAIASIDGYTNRGGEPHRALATALLFLPLLVMFFRMPTEHVEAVLDNLARSSVIVCSFEGGDPLVRDDILELLKYQYEKPWYLLFTTSERDMQQRYPMAEYGKYIDFLHISIDEGHKNLDMYDELEEYTKWGSIVTVQIVVTKNDIGALEQKIRRCYDAGVKAVVMCAVHLKNTKDHLPDLWQMSRVGMEMKRKYPGVIISPDGYFDRITWDHGCDSSSIIVDADGFLWYPCRVLEEKTINLIDSDLMTYLESDDAHERRGRMAACDIQCAWYQYYATQSFVNPRELLSAWMPYYRDLLNKGKQPVFAAPAMRPVDPQAMIHAQILQESAMKGASSSGGLVDLPTIQSPGR